MPPQELDLLGVRAFVTFDLSRRSCKALAHMPCTTFASWRSSFCPSSDTSSEYRVLCNCTLCGCKQSMNMKCFYVSWCKQIHPGAIHLDAQSYMMYILLMSFDFLNFKMNAKSARTFSSVSREVDRDLFALVKLAVVTPESWAQGFVPYELCDRLDT